MNNKILNNRFQFFLFFFICILISQFCLPCISAAESLIVSELKEAVKEHGFDINATIVHNKETKLQDLSITPIENHSYSSGSFIYAITNGVSKVTSRSFAYKLFIGMVIIDINDELWAISAENCRKVFGYDTVAKQNEMLRKSLKRLRY